MVKIKNIKLAVDFRFDKAPR